MTCCMIFLGSSTLNPPLFRSGIMDMIQAMPASPGVAVSIRTFPCSLVLLAETMLDSFLGVNREFWHIWLDRLLRAFISKQTAENSTSEPPGSPICELICFVSALDCWVWRGFFLDIWCHLCLAGLGSLPPWLPQGTVHYSPDNCSSNRSVGFDII